MKDTTAVEFLAKSLKDFPHIKHSFRFKELVEQAKEMEKKQMIGLLQWMNRVTQSDPMRLETDDDDVVEQYYLETYGGNK